MKTRTFHVLVKLVEPISYLPSSSRHNFSRISFFYTTSNTHPCLRLHRSIVTSSSPLSLHLRAPNPSNRFFTIPHNFEPCRLGVAASSHSYGRLQSPHQFPGALAAHIPRRPARLHRIQHPDNGERSFHLVSSCPAFSSHNPARVIQSDICFVVSARKSTRPIMWSLSTCMTTVQSYADPSQPTVQ